MRSFHLGSVPGGRCFRSRNVILPRAFDDGIKVPAILAPRRWHSNKIEVEEAQQWTRHSLKPSKNAASESSILSKAFQNAGKTHTAYIALGSNLGDRIEWIEKACNEMSARGIKVKRTSSLWETEPMYVLDQDSFVNGACEVETTLEPLALLDELQSIENHLGREKIIDKGPRNIDLDILLYDDHTVDHERLKIPHQSMFEREFVLRPLAELIPGRSLDTSSPWKVTADYLNALPPSKSQLSTITPLAKGSQPLRSLISSRKTHVMAILNTTPDSFSDGGVHFAKLQELSERVKFFTDSGATIIDIGGQTTAPMAKEVSVEEEIGRTSPAIELIRTVFPTLPISIDTYRASVAEAAVKAGADIINDVSAGQLDPDMLPTMARLGKTVCLMHMRGTPTTMSTLTSYPSGLIPTIAQELLERVAEAEAAGIRRWRIILDPGIGFAKDMEQNLEILRRFDELRDWPGLRGFPWLVGSSRKKFIGTITGVKSAEKRKWGTAVTVAAAVQGGADLVRVHDVKEMSQVVKMCDALWRV